MERITVTPFFGPYHRLQMIVNSYTCRDGRAWAPKHARRRWIARLLGVLLLGAVVLADAAELTVTVRDRRDQPVADVVIYAIAKHPDSVSPRLDEVAVMNQMNQEFVPHILVVQRGTLVSFPNNDTVRHHVYSFSAPKPFELSLYAGTEHAPLQFDSAGVVVLGCNIHDNMVGYILVVDTPHFAKTGVDGTTKLSGLSAGRYAIAVWTPRLREDDLPPRQELTLNDDESRSLEIEFRKRLFPAHESASGGLSWSAY